MSTLFRPEAIDGQRQSWLGEVRLVRPLALSVLVALAASVAALLVAALFLAEFTRTTRLEGTLAPARGGAGSPVLQAVLYAPPTTVGQLRPDLSVRLRYEAFAGQPGVMPASGRVVYVARTPAAAECAGCEPAPVRYLVAVALDGQSLTAGASAYPLAAGMRVQADVSLERRRLIDWLLGPAPRATPRGA